MSNQSPRINYARRLTASFFMALVAASTFAPWAQCWNFWEEWSLHWDSEYYTTDELLRGVEFTAGRWILFGTLVVIVVLQIRALPSWVAATIAGGITVLAAYQISDIFELGCFWTSAAPGLALWIAAACALITTILSTIDFILSKKRIPKG